MIRYGADGFTMVIVGSDGAETLIAQGLKARRLADYAFNAGAKDVKFDFDLRLMG